MPLSFIKKGDSAAIKRIDGNDETKRFLSHLGFVEGASVTVISEIAGNMILKVKESRIAVDKGLVKRIFI